MRLRQLIYILYIALLAVAMPVAAATPKVFTVVIDAGHGGVDVGARGNNAVEKDVNLDVALKLGKMLDKAGNVKVVYTRTDDSFVDLQKRAAIANEIKADLFISLHCNSMSQRTSWRDKVKGTVTYVMGIDAMNENLRVAQRENSVVSMEDDFSSKYQAFDVNSDESHIIFELNQQQHLQQSIAFAQEVQRQMVKVAGRVDAGVHQDSFIVLAHTAMPAVLVEMDYISNPDVEQFLTSREGATRIAQALYTAFVRYRDTLHSSATH